MNQTTSNILMISPVAFCYNKETAVNNYYQSSINQLTDNEIQKKAYQEFSTLANLLLKNKINVIVVKDTSTPLTPDSIFPNNWISFHNNGSVCIYPMFAKNRRDERRLDILNLLEEKHNFLIKKIHDLSHLEDDNIILEGTGSMVLDRKNKIAYAALSERTHLAALNQFSNKFKYNLVCFNASQTINNSRLPIYHTNVVMNIGEHIAIVCFDSIDNKKEKLNLSNTLLKSNKEIINITESQCNSFAGNMLEVNNTLGESFMIMSTNAYNSLDNKQINIINKYSNIIHSPLNTIETCGGGSARCMIAEIFLQKK